MFQCVFFLQSQHLDRIACDRSAIYGHNLMSERRSTLYNHFCRGSGCTIRWLKLLSHDDRSRSLPILGDRARSSPQNIRSQSENDRLLPKIARHYYIIPVESKQKYHNCDRHPLQHGGKTH